MRSIIVGLTVLAISLPAAAAILEHLVYTPTSLPSEQGWQFGGVDATEDEVFSLQDGVLVMDTMDLGPGSVAHYSLGLTDHPEATRATVRWRIRVTDNDSYAYIRGFTFIAWPLMGWRVMQRFNLDTARLYVGQEPVLDLDATEWHDYVLTADLENEDTPLGLTVDGATVPYPEDDWTGAIWNRCVFGDMATFGNGRAEIAEIEITVWSDDGVATRARTLSALRSYFAD